MIKGLRFLSTSEELKNRLVARAKYHDERAAEKEAELPNLRETLGRIKATKPTTSVSNKTMSNYQLDPDAPIEELEKDIKNHRNSGASFQYMADHLFSEDYDLEENDLIRLEILRRNY